MAITQLFQRQFESVAPAWCGAQVLDTWGSSVGEMGAFTSRRDQRLDQLIKIILRDVRALPEDQLYITAACQGYFLGIYMRPGSESCIVWANARNRYWESSVCSIPRCDAVCWVSQ